jgi:3-hydroxyacyl-CoA dehydrogenase / enoyl-CoA hydratase / 3-hydroxybutyryl-CoA epimerase
MKKPRDRKPDPRTDRTFDPPPLETGHDGEWLDLGQSHWLARRDGDDVLWLVLVQRGVGTNTLSADVLEQLAGLLEHGAQSRPRAVVLRSGKRDSFIVGNDIGAYRGLTRAEAHVRVARSQAVVNGVAALKMPTIAVVHGRCLGGGLQLALACDYRIARTDALLGLPEVRFGVHPGLGGTARLSALIGPDQALRLILTGKSLTAAEALKHGLVDVVGEEQHFVAAVRSAAAGNLELHRPGARARALTLRPTRKRIVNQARRETERRVRAEHHPAPYRLLELWERHGASAAGLMDHEAASFADLVTSATARNLLRVYLLGEALRERGRERASQHGALVRHVHVVGAGRMGGAIAAWCASRGLLVTLEDLGMAQIAPAMQSAASLFQRLFSEPRSCRAAADRLVPDVAGAGRRKADLLIEAVPEQLELKQRVMADMEAAAHSGALLATTASGIAVEEIAAAIRRPERLAGLHFFDPVSRMRLVEVVRHDRLDGSVVDRLMGFATAIDRLPVAVRSSPGLLVNRILAPYLLEALALLEEGTRAEQVDAAAEQFGMPVGPLELADRIGLDMALDVAESLQHKLDASLPRVPEWLRRKVAQGDVGVKSGKGFYVYGPSGQPKKKAAGDVEPEHVDRLVLPMVNAAVACLAAGILDATDDAADTVDVAMVLGGGFPRFRGGPLQYARERGGAEVRSRLEVLAQRHGPRFVPHAAWTDVFGPPPPDAAARPRRPRPRRRREGR